MPTEPHMTTNKEVVKYSDEYYMLQLFEILNFPLENGPSFLNSPAKITDFMYIGGYSDAKDLVKLKKLGITHVVNLAAFWEDRQHNPYPHSSGVVAYEAYNAEDNESYPILMHFPSVRKFIDRARWTGGKVLVHCAMGINRSGVLCCAYLLDGLNMKLLDAVKRLQSQRGTVLRNRSFQQKLIRFARERDCI